MRAASVHQTATFSYTLSLQTHCRYRHTIASCTLSLQTHCLYTHYLFIDTNCTDKPVGELVCALRGFPWTVTICDKWHHRSHMTISFVIYALLCYMWWIWSNRLSHTVFEILSVRDIEVTTLTFWCHVTSSVTWQLDSQSPSAVSHW